jgi:adenine-specific DNA methylase
MIQRYLGNKNSIADHILHEVGRFCQPGDIVCDIFSGTISMSMALKRSGYRVISNDISIFSYHYANCYLRNNTIPVFDLGLLGISGADFENIAQEVIEKKKDEVGFLFLRNQHLYELYKNLVIVLIYLERIEATDIAKKFQARYIYNTYTEEGNNSYFRSLRGTEGHRRFFTPANGKRIDNILNKIREWNDNHLLSEVQYSLLISILCESIEKISNTQGTYHDFQRELYDERALHDLTLRIPPFDDVVSTQNEHIIGKAQDSLNFIKEVPKHKLLYLDPPYNFRQYTSYYFMLNLICNYCTIKNLNKYFKNVKFVRGQNMDDDFDSTFCKSDKFIESLHQLISDARTQYVIMSYYDGRNHENKGTHRKDNGIAAIVNLFESDMFKAGSFEQLAFERTNYQSFQGHTADKCNEYLFIAEKR